MKAPQVANLFPHGTQGPFGEGNLEVTDLLVRGSGMRLERIVSQGQASPPGFWYDQPDDEWVTLLRGTAVLAFEDDTRIDLRAGDHLRIPAHVKHRVESVSPDAVWLALHAPTLVRGDESE